jgi:inhibitor of Bruton tyrosine kinase
MTSGTGHTTLLHAYIHLRNQQTFQRVIAQVSSAQLSDSGITLATSPKSPKSKHRKDKDDAVDVNARDSLGRTPLHLASAMTEPSSAEYVRMLLKCPGINVNLPDRESGWTALHRAMYIGNLGVM